MLEVLVPLGIVAVLKIGYAAINARHGVKLAINCVRLQQGGSDAARRQAGFRLRLRCLLDR